MVIRSAPVDPAKVGIDSNRCPFCGKVTRVWVYSKDYWIWVMERPPVTEVFPYLSPGERETLITGVDDDCWNKYIKQPEDSE